MNVQEYISTYLSSFCASRGIQMSLPCNQIVRQKCGADYSLFVRQPQFAFLSLYLDEIIKNLPEHSKSWPVPIVLCRLSPDSRYLDCTFDRICAFKQIVKQVTNESCIFNGAANLGRNTKCGIVVIPEQFEFNQRRSTVLETLVKSLCCDLGEVISVWTNDEHTDFTTGDNSCLRQFFDSERNAINLRQFIEETKQTDYYDPNIGLCYKDSEACTIAGLINAKLGELLSSERNDESLVLIYISPNNRRFVSQQVAILTHLMLSARSVKLRQVCVTHGGVDVVKGLSLEEYRSLVQEHVTETCKERFVRINDECLGIIQTLTDTKLTFDMLSRRESARIRLDRGASLQTGGKDGLFVQYTCARLAAILNHVSDDVTSGRYPPPSTNLDSLAFDQLTGNDEWLLYHAILRCHTTIMKIYDNFKKATIIETADDTIISQSFEINLGGHTLCQELIALSVEFSAFYSKVRILVEPQPHLVGGMYARVALLKVVQQVLRRGLSMLGLTTVERM